MTLRQITIDSSVKYVRKNVNLFSKQAPQISSRRMKNASDNEKLSQNNKKQLEKKQEKGLYYLNEQRIVAFN